MLVALSLPVLLGSLPGAVRPILVSGLLPLSIAPLPFLLRPLALCCRYRRERDWVARLDRGQGLVASLAALI
jgi:hypothetical protein